MCSGKHSHLFCVLGGYGGGGGGGGSRGSFGGGDGYNGFGDGKCIVHFLFPPMLEPAVSLHLGSEVYFGDNVVIAIMKIKCLHCRAVKS